MVTCSECGSTSVEVAVWYDPNLKKITDDYGTWNATDSKWCRDCKKHVPLEGDNVQHLTPDSNREQQD